MPLIFVIYVKHRKLLKIQNLEKLKSRIKIKGIWIDILCNLNSLLVYYLAKIHFQNYQKYTNLDKPPTIAQLIL